MSAEHDVEGDTQYEARPRERYLALSLLACALVTAAAIVLSYQLVRSQRVDVGAAYAGPFVSGFFSDEADLSYRYRWTKARSYVLFNGAGSAAPQQVSLQAQGFRPSGFGQPVTMTVSVNGRPLQPGVVTLTLQLATYQFSAPAEATFSPPYVVAIDTPTYRPTGDARDLGVKVASVQLDQQGSGINAPPLGMLVWPAIFIMGLFYLVSAAYSLLLSRIRLSHGATRQYAARRTLYLPSLVVSVGALAAILAFRLPASVFLPPLAQAAGLAALLHWQWRRVVEWPLWVDRLGRLATAKWLMLAGMLLYAALSLWVLPQVDWIGHADYAENAVIARNVVNGRGLTVDYVAQFYDPQPSLTHPADTWPLLQPMLIAPFFALLGPQTWVAKLPNLFILLGLAWAVFSLASRLWDSRAGLLGGLFVLLHPYFFNAVLYPINDLAFTAIFFVLAWLVWHTVLPMQDVPPPGAEEESLRREPASELQPSGLMGRLRAWAIGALSGLLIWSKPSGGALLVGLALWAGWTWWRTGARHINWRGLVPLAPIAGAFVIVLLPLFVRNLLAFGKPFFSTEGYDAWILRYWPVHQWEDIYKVYTGGERPNFRWVTGGKFGYENLFKAVELNLGWVWKRGVLGEQGSSDFVLGLLPLAISAVGLAATTRRVAGLFGMVGLCIGLYAAFVLGYWHYEGRYFQVAVPWLYMLLAWGLFWVWDRLRERLREGLGRRWSLLLLPLALLAVALPSLAAIRTQIEADRRPTGFVAGMAWLKANTTPSDVIMTRDPWELNWYAERKAVMIPNDDLATINRISQQYGVTYLQLGGPVDGINVLDCPSGPAPESAYPTGVRPQFGRLYCGVEKPGYKLVYRQGGLTIFKLVPK